MTLALHHNTDEQHYLQLSEVQLELAQLKAKAQVRRVLVPEFVERSLSLFNLNEQPLQEIDCD